MLRDVRKRVKALIRGTPEKGDQPDATDAFPAWLKEPAKAIFAALLTAGGLITFVSAVGGAVIWVRFYAAQLPADQALAALPRGELIASGAVMLAAFLILGASAALALYLFQQRMLLGGDYRIVLGLMVLVTIETLVLVAFAVEAERARRVVAAEAIVFLALAVLLVHRWRHDLLLRPRSPACRKRVPTRSKSSVPRVAEYVAGILLVGVAIVTIVGWVDGGVDDRWLAWALVLGGTLLLLAIYLTLRWIFQDPSPVKAPVWNPERDRRLGMAGLVVLVAAVVAAPTLILWQQWVAVALSTAILLAFASWRLARTVTTYRVFLCAVAVFVSVPLLGAVAGIVRSLENPQVQPVALIRVGDRVTEAIQGIYVTETDDRLYFANVATDGCSGEIEPRSGRLLSVPRADIVAMALGPPQSVQEAGTKALEMYYALAPGAFAAARTGGSAASGKAGGEKVVAKRRLENVGPALRRDFDLDPALVPPEVKVGEPVTLKQRRADDDATRHTVRIGSTQVKAFEGEPSWGKRRALDLPVPEGVSDGLVTIECGDLATQPFLMVRQQPNARIHLVLRRGRQEAVLDGRQSTDRGAGRIKTWAWKVQGRHIGRGRRIKRSLPTADGVYDLSLRVVDDDGDAERAVLRLWRQTAVPARARGEGRKLILPKGLRDNLDRKRVRLELHGYAAPSRQARGAVRRFVRRLRAAVDHASEGSIDVNAVRMPASGGRCPRARAGVSRRPYVDVFLVTPRAGVQVPGRCRRASL